MNLRVFVLIAAMAAFGALWSSDGRYQAEQLAIVRAERARATNVAFLTRFGRDVAIPTVNRTASPATSVTLDESETSRSRAVLTLQALLAAGKMRPSLDGTANGSSPRSPSNDWPSRESWASIRGTVPLRSPLAPLL
jgi:hypothetical protein